MGILRRARERGKPLPERLEIALRMQAGLPVDDGAENLRESPIPFAANQRDEVRELPDVAGTVTAEPGMKQQTFVACMTPWDTQRSRIFAPEGAAPTLAGSSGDAGKNPGGLVFIAGFNAGAGAKAGGIGYSEEIAPTLKASQSGNMMPSVLCLNDQGGGRMGHSEEISGTLRAQEHGHQPLVLYESHGIDARYTGPRPLAPTMSARYGTGGNNLPLVAREGDVTALFVRQRADRFQERDTASTESARQHKDATDLILQPNAPACLLIRRLLPRECERLQGFPDDWTALPGASDSARYKALGNSVPVPCVEYLMEGIAKAMREEL